MGAEPRHAEVGELSGRSGFLSLLRCVTLGQCLALSGLQPLICNTWRLNSVDLQGSPSSDPLEFFRSPWKTGLFALSEGGDALEPQAPGPGGLFCLLWSSQMGLLGGRGLGKASGRLGCLPRCSLVWSRLSGQPGLCLAPCPPLPPGGVACAAGTGGGRGGGVGEARTPSPAQRRPLLAPSRGELLLLGSPAVP